MKKIIKLLALLLIQLLISLAFIISFQQRFEFVPILVPVHISVVMLLTISLYCLLGALASYRKFRHLRLAPTFVSTVLAIQMILLLLLYLTDYLANHLGSHNISLNLVGVYFSEMSHFSRIIPISPYVLTAFFAGVIVSVFLIYQRLSNLIWQGLEALFHPDLPTSFFNHKLSAAIVVIWFVVVLSSVLNVFWSRHDVQRREIWNAEPILSLFGFWDHFGDDPYRAQIIEKDRSARQLYSTPKPFEKKNVILIIADSLRADHMQVYGYNRRNTPFLNQLIKQDKMKRVEMAVATCPESACGILSTLASKNYDSIARYNFKLNELLWDQGYKVYYLLSGDQTYYENLRWYFGSSLDLYFDGNNAQDFPMYDDHVVLEGLEKVPNYDKDPAFFYFHLMSTHYIGDKLDEYNYFQPSESQEGYEALWKSDPVSRTNRYDNGVLQTDAMIEKIFSGLDEKGYLRDSLVVIISDHGEGLGEHGHFGHDFNIYQEDINIPFLIYDSPEIHYKNLDFATQLDVAPTILDRLGLPIPTVWEGISLRTGDRNCCSRHHTRNTHIKAVICRDGDKTHKYMRWPSREDGYVREELYELVQDPDETNNLVLRSTQSFLDRMRSKIIEPKTMAESGQSHTCE